MCVLRVSVCAFLLLPSPPAYTHSSLSTFPLNKFLLSVDPWLRLLQRDFPSMAVPGSFVGQQQQHQLFHRTAKELLSIRIAGVNPKFREEREVQRLKKEFRGKIVTFLVRHPTHAVVAEAKIPIVSRKSNPNSFQKKSHALTVHRVLSMSEYKRCTVVLQMPGGLTLLTSRVEEIAGDDGGDGESLSWKLYTGSNRLEPMCTGFQDKEWDAVDHDSSIFFCLSFKCAYPASLDVHSVDQAALRRASPTAVVESVIEPAHLFDSPPHSAIDYFKVVAFLMVLARHCRSYATEIARLKSRFDEMYMLVEVRDVREKIRGSSPDKPDLCLKDTVAFALVPVADQNALFRLFTAQRTQLQFVGQNGESERLPPPKNRVARISVLDLGSDRVMKLGECGFYDGVDDEEEVSNPFSLSTLNFSATSVADFTLICKERLVAGQAAKYTATVQLSVEAATSYMMEEVEPPEFASILELWKFWEICLTGDSY